MYWLLERSGEEGKYRNKVKRVSREKEAKDAVVVEVVCTREGGGDCDGGKRILRAGLRGDGFLL